MHMKRSYRYCPKVGVTLYSESGFQTTLMGRRNIDSAQFSCGTEENDNGILEELVQNTVTISHHLTMQPLLGAEAHVRVTDEFDVNGDVI